MDESFDMVGGRCVVRLERSLPGARLDLTETVPADAPDECQRALALWATTIDVLARRLRE